jgi:Protein of unknown function (DUF2783)
MNRQASTKFDGQFNLSDGDGFYEALIETHRELSLEQSHQLNARLVLMMANQVGDLDILKSILLAARGNLLKSAA